MLYGVTGTLNMADIAQKMPQIPPSVFDGFTPDSFVDLMRVNYGPVLRVFNRLADDPGRTEALDAALRRFVRTHDHGEPGRPRLEAEYQLTLARRR